MKHIKFKAVPVAPGFKVVSIQILEQTHRNKEFGNCDGGEEYAAKNGYVLGSVNRPAKSAISNKAYLRGNNTHRDMDTFELPVAKYAKFKAAVEEYNEFYKDKPAATDPCAVIVG